MTKILGVALALYLASLFSGFIKDAEAAILRQNVVPAIPRMSKS
jgi:hypothetical protein